MHQKRWRIRWNTMKILVFGFLGVIFLGGVLLWLPVCNQQPIAFQDALFTSVTAVCATGLVTITPAVQFTLLGKVILLALIQIGGLGVIGCAASFFLILRKKITVKERVVLQETYNMDKLGGMVGLVKKVIIGTFIVEGAELCSIVSSSCRSTACSAVSGIRCFIRSRRSVMQGSISWEVEALPNMRPIR